MFSAIQSAEAAAIGINQAESGQTEAWNEAALEAVRKTARRHLRFTADLVWESLSLEDRGSKRAMGAAIRRAQSHGWIKNTGETQKTSRITAHRANHSVWESLIFEDGIKSKEN